MASDEDIFLVSGYGERALAADEAGTARPRPTPREAAAFERLEEPRLRDLQERLGRVVVAPLLTIRGRAG